MHPHHPPNTRSLRTLVRAGMLLGLSVPAVFAPACSTTFTPKACVADADCGEGFACVEGTVPACQRALDAPLRVGMSAPLTGPSQSLGLEMSKGVKLAFDEQNRKGGVRGRPLVLDVRDDQYIPDAAETRVTELLDVRIVGPEPRCPTTGVPLTDGDKPTSQRGALERGPGSVFALLGNVGTPTMVRTAPLAIETKALFFGPFTGANLMLRDQKAAACSSYIFNVRASYAQEARATAEFFLKLGVLDAAHFVSFDQEDSFGQAGYDGLSSALKALNVTGADTPITRFRYKRDDTTSVPMQVKAAGEHLDRLLAGSPGVQHTVGIFMTDTYGPAVSFIEGIKDWLYGPGSSGTERATRLTLYFSNVSFVGPDELADRLRMAGSVPLTSVPYADGVFVSQVVPNYQTDRGAGVSAYRVALADAAEAGEVNTSPSFTSLEGYLTARVFIEGLLASPRSSDVETLIEAFETMPGVALGLGGTARFSPQDHQYSKSVWGTEVGADGTFANRYLWTEGTPVQFFE
jgi:branched-chain amino acid transport system substrate-binding protein